MEVLINEKDVDFGCDISVLLNRGDRLRWSWKQNGGKNGACESRYTLAASGSEQEKQLGCF